MKRNSEYPRFSGEFTTGGKLKDMKSIGFKKSKVYPKTIFRAGNELSRVSSFKLTVVLPHNVNPSQLLGWATIVIPVASK
jgi:hypothetical protein